MRIQTTRIIYLCRYEWLVNTNSYYIIIFNKYVNVNNEGNSENIFNVVMPMDESGTL